MILGDTYRKCILTLVPALGTTRGSIHVVLALAALGRVIGARADWGVKGAIPVGPGSPGRDQFNYIVTAAAAFWTLEYPTYCSYEYLVQSNK